MAIKRGNKMMVRSVKKFFYYFLRIEKTDPLVVCCV